MDTPRKPGRSTPKQKLPKPKTTAGKPGRPAARKKSKTLSPAEAHRSVGDARTLVVALDEIIDGIADPLGGLVALGAYNQGPKSLLMSKIVAATEHLKEVRELLREAQGVAHDSASIVVEISLLKAFFSKENKKIQNEFGGVERQTDLILDALGFHSSQVLHKGRLMKEEVDALRSLAADNGIKNLSLRTDDLIDAVVKKSLPDIRTAGGKIAIKPASQRDSRALVVLARLHHLTARHISEFSKRQNYEIPDKETQDAYDSMKPPKRPEPISPLSDEDFSLFFGEH